MASLVDNYIMARDTSEADRLNLQHEYMLSCQGYYLHPDIEVPATGARIADLCTGTAIFLHELAEANPATEYHGFDISDQMFPPQTKLPENVHLHLANVKKPFEERWLGYFDVVHLRLIEGAMTKEEWAPLLCNIVTLLKPGGWLQWVEDDRAHSVRHTARPVAPAGAAKESLLATATGKHRFVPSRFPHMGARFTRPMMPNARADDMTYGYMNLDALMRDPEVGDLEQVGCDLYVVDREDDGGKLRRDWGFMGAAAIWSGITAMQAAGKEVVDISREELVEGTTRDVAAGGHYITRVSVFTGRKKL